MIAPLVKELEDTAKFLRAVVDMFDIPEHVVKALREKAERLERVAAAVDAHEDQRNAEEGEIP